MGKNYPYFSCLQASQRFNSKKYFSLLGLTMIMNMIIYKNILKLQQESQKCRLHICTCIFSVSDETCRIWGWGAIEAKFLFYMGPNLTHNAFQRDILKVFFLITPLVPKISSYTLKYPYFRSI